MKQDWHPDELLQYGRVMCRFNNSRNDEIHVILKAKHR